MRFRRLIWFLVFWVPLIIAVAAQEAGPAAVQPALDQMEDPELPAAPEENGSSPDLLPEAIPAPTARPGASAPTLKSAQPRLSRRQRLAKMRAQAMRSPRAVALLRNAHRATSSRMKRKYLRAYYATVRAQIRKLDSSSNAYQQLRSDRSVSSRKSGRKRTPRHSVTKHHHHRVIHTYHSPHYDRVYEPEDEGFFPPPFYYGPPPW